MARNSVAANLLMMALLVGGVFSIANIKQEVFPEFELDFVNISVSYPGASPEEVEQGIVLAIEEAIRGLDGVKRVTARANEGLGTVSAELLEDKDPNLALQDIKNEVDRITTFPEEAERPTVSLAARRREVITLVIYGDVGERALRDVAEMAKDELLQYDGITLIDVIGTRPLEISIEVPREKMRAHNLTLSEIAEQVRLGTVELSGGGVKTPSGEVLIRTMERRDYGMEYGDIPVVSQADGTKVRLKDIAEIRDGFEDIDRAGFFNGLPAVGLEVYRVGDEKPIDIADKVKAYAKILEDRLPPGLSVTTTSDRSEIYKDRLYLLLKNASIGLILVMIILGVFLEVRLAFWVMLGIPTSFLGCLLFLPYLDVSINMISLFAFIVAVGIVVDDAIVVGESIYYMRGRKDNYVDAATHGAQLVAGPVVFSILTNVVAFMPLLFVPGTMGQIWSNIPIVIIIVFLISLVEALYILPAHLAHQKKSRKGLFWDIVEYPQRKVGRRLEQFVDRFYTPFIKGALRHRYITLAAAFAVLIITIGFVRGGRLPFTFFPKVESDRVRASAVLPYGVPIEQTMEVKEQLVAAAKQVLDEHGGEAITEGLYSVVGSGGGGGGPMPSGGGSGSHLAEVTVFLVPLAKREITAAEFTRLWRKRTGELPGIESLTFDFTIGPSGNTPIDIEVSHPDPQTLEEIAVEVADALREYDGVLDIDDGIARGKRQWDFSIKPAARSLGVTAGLLSRQLRDAFYGAEVKRQQRGQDEVKIYVRLPEEQRNTEEDIDRLVIRTPGGGEIPLHEAADIKYDRAYEEIKRADARRVLNVTADVDSKITTSGEVLTELRAKTMQQLKRHHPNLSYSFEGERRDFRESMSSLGRNFAFALLILFAMLAIPFRSYIQAVIILLAIPFGIVGAVAGHLIMGFDLSIISVMGMVALGGVVINDNILLVDTVNNYRDEGMSVAEAASAAPARRFRPVLLTSLTTFMGLAPMILETSVQARFLIPMALSLGFGILFATVITLILTPTLYLVIEDVRSLLTRSA
jgi:multidrug efflux pump subunit AcrB